MMVVQYRADAGKIRLSERERLFLLEIGNDTIDSASSFVNYIAEVYGIARSSSWYCLKRMKRMGLLHFASKSDDSNSGMFLTDLGKTAIQGIPSVSYTTMVEKNRITLENRDMYPLG